MAHSITTRPSGIKGYYLRISSKSKRPRDGSGAQDLVFAAYAGAIEPAADRRGALRVVLVRSGGQELQATLTAHCQSEVFYPVTTAEPVREGGDVVELRIESGEQP